MNINYKDLEKEIIRVVNVKFNTTHFDYTNRGKLNNQRIELEEILILLINIVERATLPVGKELLNMLNYLLETLLTGSTFFTVGDLKDCYNAFNDYIENNSIELPKGNLVNWFYIDETTKRLTKIEEA